MHEPIGAARLRKFAALAGLAPALLVLSACDGLADDSDRFDNLNLTSEELEVAQALVTGFKKETGLPILRSREYGRAACYSRMVEMPDHLKRAHLAYLADYPEADADYYGYFAKMGVSETDAYEVYQRFEVADEKCSADALVRKLFGE
ncbi:hypothetical protein [Croceicoccus bisphenolivorans]|uniref:hypothetical protein n=1 Tax=Croceicoccus bisphenolivorans TaxID=1783232 RepID=UPI00082C463A|nr:hypothetical protein [Croceicoccus bisphenolivorans]